MRNLDGCKTLVITKKQPPEFPPTAATQRAIMLRLNNSSKSDNHRKISRFQKGLPTVRTDFFYNGLEFDLAHGQGLVKGFHLAFQHSNPQPRLDHNPDKKMYPGYRTMYLKRTPFMRFGKKGRKLITFHNF